MPEPVRARLFISCVAVAWLPLDRRQIRAALEEMAAALAWADWPLPGPVEAHLVDDASISAANWRHLGCMGPTNVLSFPQQGGLPGELLLSLDTWRRECLLYGQNLTEHLLRLLAHGMAHLAGLDHGPEMDRVCALCQEAAEAGLSAAFGD